MAQVKPVKMLIQQSYDDDSREKLVEIPIINGRNVKANLYSLNEFSEAAEELTYTLEMSLFITSAKFWVAPPRQTGTPW
jgi:hypothetical protein